MTIDQAKEIKKLFDRYQERLSIKDKIRAMHREKDIDRLANYALDMAGHIVKCAKEDILNFKID